jgi:hypothetical protein
MASNKRFTISEELFDDHGVCAHMTLFASVVLMILGIIHAATSLPYETVTSILISTSIGLCICGFCCHGIGTGYRQHKLAQIRANENKSPV